MTSPSTPPAARDEERPAPGRNELIPQARTTNPLRQPGDGVTAGAVDPRVLMANERTLLAWIRTAVGLMAFGFVMARANVWVEGLGGRGLDGGATLRWVGVAMVATGASSIGFAWLGYRRTHQAVLEGRDELPSSAGISVLTALLLGAGLVLTAVLAAFGSDG